MTTSVYLKLFNHLVVDLELHSLEEVSPSIGQGNVQTIFNTVVLYHISMNLEHSLVEPQELARVFHLDWLTCKVIVLVVEKDILYSCH